ncbi:MAG: hypothetical protein IJT01_06610 [Selenomonadaceae bacterium]|nr:hypothetical protein [Selenomonadaceae bacterium]
MKQMTLKLIEKYQRPVVKLDDFFGLEAMIDTGAVYPVWMSGEERLRRLGAVKKKDSVPFGGLGGMTNGALYKIPIFQLGDLLYPDMGIIAHRSNFPVPLLLPATMFNNLIYEINNKTHRLNITVPDDESISRNLTIKYENEQLYVFCSSAE